MSILHLPACIEWTFPLLVSSLSTYSLFSDLIFLYSDLTFFPTACLPDAWPNSSIAATEAVAEARRTRGVEVDADAGWGPEDLVVTLDARVPHVKGALCTFKIGVQKLNDMLFKSQTK